MALSVNRWLLRYGKLAAQEAIDGLSKRKLVAKVGKKDKEKLQLELLEIIRKFGLRTFDESGKDAATAAGGRWEFRPQVFNDFIDSRLPRVKNLIADTEIAVKESLNRIVRDARREDLQPSSKDVARRIARQWHGPADGRQTVFGFERANTIARMELGLVQNEAIVEGFEVAGVKKLGWLAHGNDGKSGEREHYKMNRHAPITLKASRGSDRSKWFKLPDGARMRYAQWEGGPVRHLVNCRCTSVPER